MDDDVIGSAFYVMSMEEGRVFWDPTLPSQTPETGARSSPAKSRRWQSFTSSIPRDRARRFRQAGQLFRASGRSLDQAISRLRNPAIPEFEKLAEWLPKTVPQQARVSIVHGDYRLDNMIFHADGAARQAVLDWELSTLGDPMADFTYLLMQWTMPGLANADLKALNIPTMEEAAEIYCDVRRAVPDLNWYFAYNLFRLAGIMQGIAGRVSDGTAASAKAHGSRPRARAAGESLLGIRAEGRRDLDARRWVYFGTLPEHIDGRLLSWPVVPMASDITINNSITKVVSSEMNFGQVMLVRGLFAIMLVAAFAWYQGALRPLRDAGAKSRWPCG